MPTIDELQIVTDTARQAVTAALATADATAIVAAQAAAAVADLDYGNAVNAAARQTETDQLNAEADHIRTARAMANQIRVTR